MQKIQPDISTTATGLLILTLPPDEYIAKSLLMSSNGIASPDEMRKYLKSMSKKIEALTAINETKSSNNKEEVVEENSTLKTDNNKYYYDSLNEACKQNIFDINHDDDIDPNGVGILVMDDTSFLVDPVC